MAIEQELSARFNEGQPQPFSPEEVQALELLKLQMHPLDFEQYVSQLLLVKQQHGSHFAQQSIIDLLI